MAVTADKRNAELKIRLPVALADDMRRVAVDNDRSLAAELRRAVKQHVARQQHKKP